MGGRGVAEPVTGRRPASMARLVVYSAAVSLVTFIAGIGVLIALTRGQKQATCDLVRAQVQAYAETPPEPNTRAADLAAAWIRFGHSQGCIK
jgi:hypothetical protein